MKEEEDSSADLEGLPKYAFFQRVLIGLSMTKVGGVEFYNVQVGISALIRGHNMNNLICDSGLLQN